MDHLALLATIFDVAMKIANLLLEYLKVLVWPAAVLTLALIYRRPLIHLLHRIREASGWGLSVKAEASDLALDAQITRVAEEATRSAQAPAPAEPASPPPTDDNDAQSSTPATTTPADPIPPETSPEHEPIEPHPSPSAPDLPPTKRADEEMLDRLQPHTTNDKRRLLAQLNRLRHQNYSWDPGVDFIDGRSANQRTARVETAWLTLTGLSFMIGKSLGLHRSERKPTNVVQNLAKLGYVTVGPWRIATRLERLYDVIRSDPNPPTAEVAEDFVEAANDLTSILVSVNERLKTNDPDSDTPT